MFEWETQSTARHRVHGRPKPQPQRQNRSHDPDGLHRAGTSMLARRSWTMNASRSCNRSARWSTRRKRCAARSGKTSAPLFGNGGKPVDCPRNHWRCSARVDTSNESPGNEEKRIVAHRLATPNRLLQGGGANLRPPTNLESLEATAITYRRRLRLCRSGRRNSLPP